MKLRGIEFAPLNVPLQRRLETLAAGGCFIVLSFGPLVGLIVAIYLMLCTSYHYYILIYLAWIYFIDYNTCNVGGRRTKWVRSLSWWKYMKNYFPFSLQKVDGINLDPSKNYIFCAFPHGMFPLSVFSAFATEWGDFTKLFPRFTIYGITLNLNFFIPFYREFVLSMGLCSANAKSIMFLLNKREGGNIALISVGGAAEAMYSKPRHYHFILKNRKGFVKLALQTGSPIVPVLSFGEPDLFDQVSNPEGSVLRKFQEWVKKLAGFVPIIPIGRGFFQYTFGLIPRRKPVTTVVGVPLEVKKIQNPTAEEISDVHQKFMDHLVNFFEQYKHKYLTNADEIKLIIS